MADTNIQESNNEIVKVLILKITIKAFVFHNKTITIKAICQYRTLIAMKVKASHELENYSTIKNCEVK